MHDPRSIVITGASSGIGAALARAYAGPGVSLALGGRDLARLAVVASQCRTMGAAVEEMATDVVDQGAMERWLKDVDERQPIDLAIANAGISAGTASGWETPEQTRTVFAVNLEGVFNTVLPLLPAMKRRGRGQIALMSSLASFRGFPGAPAYSASKAAVRVWGEALRGDLWDAGIRVSVICPGFVVSPMTDRNKFHMPMLIGADRAAQIIKRRLARGQARIGFPWPVLAAAWFIGLLPPSWLDPLLRQMPKKS